jgi:predicted N-acetyltransferase YhbS
MALRYNVPTSYDLDEVIQLYRRSTLDQRRPVENRDIMDRMMQEADLLIFARDDARLVGLARTLTDFAYVAYLADLAVDAAYQRRGIGRRLIEETSARLDPTCMMTLLAAPAAQDYYAKVGFTAHPRAWWKPGTIPPLEPS